MDPVTDAPVRLRPVGPADLPRMYELQLDPEANRLAATIPRTREGFDAHWADALSDPAVTARTILLGDQVVGYVACFPQHGQAHVGYWIDRPHWGKGIASRALSLLLSEVAHRPLVAVAAASNGASLRVLQKCGFVVERVRAEPATERHPACEVAVHVLREDAPRPGAGVPSGGPKVCDLDTSVPDWVIDHPAALAVFNEVGIDIACGGKSLGYACRQRGLDPGAVLAMLHRRLGEGRQDGHPDPIFPLLTLGSTR